MFTLVLLLAPWFSQAEQKMTLGQWDVHYIVVNTSFLTPEVANQYDIVRSKYSALVNLSVLNNETLEAQNVAVSGTATNLLGNAQPLRFKKVTEGKAIYYLATFPFENADTYRFSISLQRGETTRTLKFQQKLFTD
ncbi:DUF4426 domain-containing protein [Salinimonas profundi]|nr:DUF4426 domain-containing protein [Salinimonas profundi]